MHKAEHSGGEVTLFQIEDTTALLAESAEEDGLTPEIEQALAAYLQGALEKRDRVAEFILYCEGMADRAKSEGQRLQARQKHFESHSESSTTAASVNWRQDPHVDKRKCPASVAIRNQTKISAEFKRVSVTLPASRWELLLAALPKECRSKCAVKSSNKKRLRSRRSRKC